MQIVQPSTPEKATRWLGLIALYLAVQSLVNEYLLENVVPGSNSSLVISFMELFSVNAEETIPTWYATILLFVSAVLLGAIAAVKRQTRDPHTGYWAGLSLIFFYLSLDEGAVIHELFSTPLETTFNTSGYLTFAWLIVFIPLLLIFALLYLRFLLRLPSRIRNFFVLAGLFYVGGAVIVEAISANRYAIDGGVSFPYLAIATVEELMEMWGVVLFIYSLLSYMVVEGITAVISPTPLTVQTMAVIPSPITSSRRLRLVAVLILLAFNSAMIAWAFRQQSVSVIATDTSLYQIATERFKDQGVIILGINEAIMTNNPAAPPIAAALLTLFDDVVVVTLPSAQVSIAFASHHLPFNIDTLTQLIQQSGESDFTILNAPALRAIADKITTP